MSALAGGREAVAGRNGHLTRVVKRSPARADLNVLARAVVVLARLVKRLVGHVGHLLMCAESHFVPNEMSFDKDEPLFGQY